MVDTIPDVAAELAKAVDAIMAAEGAISRALALPHGADPSVAIELPRLRAIRQRLMAARR